jgi:hypothetical protein
MSVFKRFASIGHPDKYGYIFDSNSFLTAGGVEGAAGSVDR